MIRIMIHWETRSPFLQVLTGVLTAEDVDCTYRDDPVLLLKCRVKVEQGATEYSAIEGDGIPSELFEKIRPVVDVMVHSYFRGSKLDNLDFVWIQESEVEESLKELVDTQKLTPLEAFTSEIEESVYNEKISKNN